jgi:hypothetical protein
VRCGSTQRRLARCCELTSEAGRRSQHARIRRCVVEKDTDMRNRLVHTLLRCRRAYHADATATSAMYRCARTPRPALCAPCKNPISMGDGTEPLFGEPQVDHQCAQSPGVVQLCASLHSEVSGQCGAHQPHREVQQQARRDASVKRQGARALGDTHFFPEQRVQGGGDREGCSETPPPLAIQNGDPGRSEDRVPTLHSGLRRVCEPLDLLFLQASPPVRAHVSPPVRVHVSPPVRVHVSPPVRVHVSTSPRLAAEYLYT